MRRLTSPVMVGMNDQKVQHAEISIYNPRKD